MTAGRLEVDAGSGRVTGPADIVYNDPFPTHNGSPGGSGAMMGAVVHTQVGNNPGTVAWFNNPASEASAFFCIAQDGQIVQMGPIGFDWAAWTQGAGNSSWYGCEFADDEHPANPLTDAQITAGAQLLELLSRFAGFPLQVTDSVDTPGLGIHSMGGVAWGNHPDCPGSVRAGQRSEIVALARDIRDGKPADPPKPPEPDPVHVAEMEGVVVVLPGGTSRKVLSSDGGKSWT
jgi:hypothetical protein